MERSGKTTLMQMQASLPKKILISLAIMSAFFMIVYIFKVPNPNMIMIVGLVLCSALFGFGGGIVASAVMLGYTLYFFSTDHSFTQFTDENMVKVAVSAIGIILDMLLICLLKQAEVRAFCKIDTLTEELQSDNEKLQHMSMTDALTGIKNRMALEKDRESYAGHTVTVVMLDVNDFKIINDTYGHREGDRILKETAKLLADAFGVQHCYRYGGDEFLVAAPDISEKDFQEKQEYIRRNRPSVDEISNVRFSIGYVRAKMKDAGDLDSLISAADERMYEEKRNKKGAPVLNTENADPEMVKASEYTVAELKTYLEEMSGKYDLARVVDPIECRILQLREDGNISLNDNCYGIWNAEQKCTNCSSAIACRTGCHQEKAEHFKDNVYLIESNPVTLKLPDGSVYEAVVELVNIEKDSEIEANDREAENAGGRAAQYLARHDIMTNVLNANAFYEMSREMIMNRPDETWTVVTGNIMNFRLINTLFGVLRGNEALVRTASMLKAMADEAQGLCGRLGGDQFAILVPKEKYREEALISIAETLSDVFSSGAYTFCIHFGVYETDDPSVPVSVMCGRANSALRTIREDLTHVVAYFNNAILQKVLFEQKVIGSFDEAVKEGQFRMYLQPLVEKDGTVIGAEALVRWILPDGTIMMPGDFIEILERAGLIQRLDIYVWELAVKQLAAWKNTKNSNLTISINMSTKDFYSIDVYEVLTGLIDRYGVDSSMLRLEITETALLIEPEKTDIVISKLRGRGFLVEIDDFGKGYSSLSLLKNIKADVLKIDMSFLHEIRDRERSCLILRSVIRLAESLSMDVITEGVETERQLRVLSEMGCSHFQGYYFSRPLPVEEFEEKFAAV